MVHMGVDHYKRVSQPAILTETDEVIERRVSHTGPHTHAALASLPGACKIAFRNDRVDAKMLAHLLRTDLLPTVWIPPRAVWDSRELDRELHHRAERDVRARRLLTIPGSESTRPLRWSPISVSWSGSLRQGTRSAMSG